MTGLRFAAVAASLALTASACGTGGANDNGGSGESQGGHLVYDEIFAPAAAWALETDDAGPLSRAGCLETLVRYDNDGSLQPMLATDWKQTDESTWEFTLRDGVEFQNGTPMDADAVAGALTHLLQAKTPARALNPDVVSSVEAVDEKTVRITTPKADPLAPLRVASANSGILAPEAYSGDNIDIQGTCTGPFEVTGEVPRQSLTLERNENYWGGDVNLDSGEMRFVVDGGTRTTQLQTGEAQIVRSIPAVNLGSLEGDDSVNTTELAQARTTVLLLNNSRPPFDDPLVRQAVQQAIDPKPIMEAVYEGLGEPAVGPFAPDSPWAPEGAEAVGGNLDEARSLLQKAGVDPSSLDIEIIAYNERAEFADLATVLQDQLRQLGIKVQIRAGEYASVEPDMLSGNFDAALLSRGYLQDVADPAGYLQSDWTCNAGYNIAQYCDQKTDQMIKDAVSTVDQDERNQMYQEIAARLQSQAASVFLLHEVAAWGARSNVENFQPHILDYYVFTADLGMGG